MKSIFLLLLFTSALVSQPGMLELFVEQQTAQLVPPQHTFLKGAALLGAAAFTVNAYEKQKTLAQSRSSLASHLFSAGLGATIFFFLFYKFVQHEMGVIIETKGVLEKLTEQIIAWKKIIPNLEQNQTDLAEKMKKALAVLDTITPLVAKLSAQTATPINPDFVIAMQNELDDLKELITQLSLCQMQTGVAGLENNDSIAQKVTELAAFNERLFGSPRHFVPLDDNPRRAT